ncbi:hypothetical protein N9401_04315 [Amylibacter sp.]|nr:hypothetical protein [Amylibacter sp.]
MLSRCFNLIITFITFFAFPQVCFGKDVTNFEISTVSLSETDSIRNYFIKNPDTDRAYWKPYYEYFDRFNFTIPRKAFFTALKFKDSSDLYYLSKINDNGLNFSDRKYSHVMLKSDATTYQLAYSKKLNNNFSFGAQIISKNRYSLGGNFSYDQIIKDKILFNLDAIIHPNQFSELDIGGVFLTDDERAEIFFKLNVFDDLRAKVLSIGKTWFDINDFTDFSSSIDFNRKSVNLSFYTEFSYNKNYINLGVKSVNDLNTPELYIGFSRVMGNKNDIKYKLQINNSNTINPKLHSLKKMRMHELPKIWQENINFEKD